MSYAYPPSGVKATLAALRHHCGRSRIKPLDEQLLNAAVSKVSSASGDIYISGPLDHEFVYDELYKKLLSASCKVKPDANPGYPLNVEYGSNEAALRSRRNEIIEVALVRIYLDSTDLDIESIAKIDGGMVELGLVDPAYVFNKNEPHPARKLKDKAYRIISGVSLPDQLIERVLSKESSEIKRLPGSIYVNGSSVGIGFTDSHMKEFANFVENKRREFGSLISDDMSGFDSLHTPQTLLATCAVDENIHKSDGGSLSLWNRCNRRWAYKCAYGCSVVGDTVYSRTHPGMLNSGSARTSEKNTVLRNLYTYCISIDSKQPDVFSTANGDDGLCFGVTDPKAYQLAAERLGFRLRDVAVCDGDSFEFCSHLYSFRTGLASLTSWPKAIYGILSKKTCLSDANQTIGEMRYNSEFNDVCTFVDRIDFN